MQMIGYSSVSKEITNLDDKNTSVEGVGRGQFLTHCNENPIYVFPEKELRGPSPNFHIHVSVSDLSETNTVFSHDSH